MRFYQILSLSALALISPAFADSVPVDVSDPHWTITALSLEFAGHLSKINSSISFTVSRGPGTDPVTCSQTWPYNALLTTRNGGNWATCSPADLSWSFPQKSFFAGWKLGSKHDTYGSTPFNMTLHVDQIKTYLNVKPPARSNTVYHNYAERFINIALPGDNSGPSAGVKCTGGSTRYTCTLAEPITLNVTPQTQTFSPLRIQELQTFTSSDDTSSVCVDILSFNTTYTDSTEEAICELQSCYGEVPWAIGTEPRVPLCAFDPYHLPTNILYVIKAQDPFWVPTDTASNGFNLSLGVENRWHVTLTNGDWGVPDRPVVKYSNYFVLPSSLFTQVCTTAGCYHRLNGPADVVSDPHVTIS